MSHSLKNKTPELTASSMPSSASEEQDIANHSEASTLKGNTSLWGLIVAVLLVVAAIVVWQQVKYRFIAKKWGVVVPGKVYRSGQISKWMIEPALKKHGIQVVIDLNGRDKKDEHQTAEVKTAEQLKIEHHRFRLSGDGTGDISHYAKAIEVINQSVEDGKPVLVHCAAGAQRTGGVVATYRMLVRGESPESAYAELPRYGWKEGDDQALVNYVNEHMQELAQLLVERGVIAEVPAVLPKLGP